MGMEALYCSNSYQTAQREQPKHLSPTFSLEEISLNIFPAFLRFWVLISLHEELASIFLVA